VSHATYSDPLGLASPILLNQTVVPDYRLPLFEALVSRYGGGLHITCGEESPTSGLRSCAQARSVAAFRRNIGLVGNRLVWQADFVEDARHASLLITEFNMRAPSTWVALGERHSRGLPSVLWGHARGRTRALDPLRIMMLRRADGFIAYTESQAEVVRKECPWLSVRTAPNAVMWSKDCWSAEKAAEQVWDTLFVGRLIASKKPGLLVQGFAAAAPKLPRKASLVFVGEGPESGSLRAEASRLGIGGRVRFHGHVSELEKLRNIYGTAVISASPGYVGLSATQSFAFGVPMLVAASEPHSPEVEACVQGVSARFFASGDVTALANALVQSYEDRDDLLSRRRSLAEWTASRYSLDRMVQAFESTISEFVPLMAGRVGA